jgi:hypothetical protein
VPSCNLVLMHPALMRPAHYHQTVSVVFRWTLAFVWRSGAETPVWLAAFRGSAAVLHEVLMAGGNPNACSGTGEPALVALLRVRPALSLSHPTRNKAPLTIRQQQATALIVPHA